MKNSRNKIVHFLIFRASKNYFHNNLLHLKKLNGHFNYSWWLVIRSRYIFVKYIQFVAFLLLAWALIDDKIKLTFKFKYTTDISYTDWPNNLRYLASSSFSKKHDRVIRNSYKLREETCASPRMYIARVSDYLHD